MKKNNESGIAKILYVIFLSIVGVLIWLLFFRKA